MAVKKEKTLLVQDIQDNFHNSSITIFYNLSGVENEEIFQLKKELKKTGKGSKIKVYKNKLVEKALNSSNLTFQLKQPNALVFCDGENDNEYKALSILLKFNKTHDEIKRFHGGIYQQNLISKETLEKWASLPSKQVLVNSLCYYLTWQVRRLINILEKVKESKNQ